MTKREALRALRMALLTLYDNPTTIRRLVDDAGIDAGPINFQGASQDIWHSVITETERQEQIPALVDAVDPPYRNNKALKEAYQAYQQAIGDGTPDSAQASAKPDNSKSNVIINTGGGNYIAGNVNTGGGDFVGRDQKK